MMNVHITVNNVNEYNEGIENLKKVGFGLKEQTFAWDLWETENTRYWVKKEF